MRRRKEVRVPSEIIVPGLPLRCEFVIGSVHKPFEVENDGVLSSDPGVAGTMQKSCSTDDCLNAMSQKA